MVDWTRFFPPLAASLPSPWLWLALGFLGLVLGFIAGFFGVGGGFLSVPMKNILFGIPYQIAVGSDLMRMVGTSTGGVIGNHRHGRIRWPLALWLGAGSVLGTFAGDELQDLFRTRMEAGSGLAFDDLMHILFLILILATAAALARPPHPSSPRHLLQSAKGRFRVRSGDGTVPVSALFPLGVLIGVLTGLLGVGGGIITVPILLVLAGLSSEESSGTSLALVMISSFSAAAKKMASSTPKVHLGVTVLLLAGSMIGVRLGSAVLKRAGGKAFRKSFLVVLGLAATAILIDIVR